MVVYGTNIDCLLGVIMIFSGSMEYEKRYNQEVQERPSDNIELPKVIANLLCLIAMFIMPPPGRLSFANGVL
jgi:hypothetical protein